jgi:hypothetical protein
MTRDEYFAQDILVRIDQAWIALERSKHDPLVFQDDNGRRRVARCVRRN